MPRSSPVSGLAIDIGTTTVDARLYRWDTNEVMAAGSEKNAQTRYGADIISRIAFANADPKNRLLLKTAILAQIDSLAARLIAPGGQTPAQAVFTGNTAMLHFLTGYSTRGLAAAPFEPESRFGFEIPWGELGESSGQAGTLPPELPVLLPPCAGAFTGADLITAVTAIADSGVPSFLLADIGTNCEIAFYRLECRSGSPARETLVCASAAAGPAFEGGGIRCGMRAAPGAICRVVLQGGGIVAETIGGVEPEGICGTGLVSAVACFLDAGLIDHTGLMTGAQNGHITLYQKAERESIVLTQQDIRSFQLAKGAVRAGMEIVLEEAGYSGPSLPLYLCGAFGSLLKNEDAERIALVPPQCAGQTRAGHNAALDGAGLLLFSEIRRETARRLARCARPLNLAEHPDFQARFMRGLNFPG
jgi:uncharacterized 2Fe-2S/4Fe-4S cluster protein (DUF4445 family)